MGLEDAGRHFSGALMLRIQASSRGPCSWLSVGVEDVDGGNDDEDDADPTGCPHQTRSTLVPSRTEGHSQKAEMNVKE